MKSLFSAILFLFLLNTATAQTVYRCGETTTKGTPCKLKVPFSGAKCHHHGGSTKSAEAGIYQNTHRCGAPTSKGLPCRNRVRQAGAKCHHHQ